MELDGDQSRSGNARTGCSIWSSTGLFRDPTRESNDRPAETGPARLEIRLRRKRDVSKLTRRVTWGLVALAAQRELRPPGARTTVRGRRCAEGGARRVGRGGLDTGRTGYGVGIVASGRVSSRRSTSTFFGWKVPMTAARADFRSGSVAACQLAWISRTRARSTSTPCF